MSEADEPAQPKIYFGTFVHCDSQKQLCISHDTLVGVNAEGKIVFIEPNAAINSSEKLATAHGWSSYKTVSFPSTAHRTNFYFPGFVDTHIHAPQYPNVGVFGNTTLLSWLNKYTFPLESSCASLSTAKRIYSQIVARTLSNGTTCAAYFATIHVPATTLLADICLQKGQRALIGRVCMDRMSPKDYRDESAEIAVKHTKLVIEHIKKIDPAGRLIRPVITPRFAPSCTNECLSALGQLHHETSHFVQTHISENKPEVELVQQLFPDCENYASVYDKAGLLSERTILAHAVHLTPEEVVLIKERNSKIAHCPASNTCLTSGAAPVRALMNSGINIGLGTDVSGGYSPSILEIVRQALLVSRHVAMGSGHQAQLNISEALWLATQGGAEVVGLGSQTGSFEVGKTWDAQLITLNNVAEDGTELASPGLSDIGPVDIFGWEVWDDRIAKWVYGGDDRNVAGVWVSGRLVHDRLAKLT